MKTAIITSESSEKHITGDGHPEQPKRVVSIIDTLKKNKELLWDKPDVVPNDILNMNILLVIIISFGTAKMISAQEYLQAYTCIMR